MLRKLTLALALFLASSVAAMAQQSGSGSFLYFSTGTITPTATGAAIGVAEQTFTVPGLVSRAAGIMDVVAIFGPAPTPLCPAVGARASANNTLQIDFAVMTAAACTPASGTYNVLVRLQ